MLEKDSAFHRLPADLDPRQACFLDGIRYAFDIACLSCRRLSCTLEELSLARLNEQRPSGELWVAAFADAWSTVDALNRLRGLLDRMPMLEKRGLVKNMLQRLSELSGLRNYVQHLADDIGKSAGARTAVWGSLSWIFVPNTSEQKVISFLLVAGRLQDGEHRMHNPLGESITARVDHIHLSAAAQTVSLSRHMATAEKLVGGIEKGLAASIAGKSAAGADLLASVDIHFSNTADS